MEQTAFGRFALALLACLACPITASALTCPPGEREVSGRCVPDPVPHFEKKSGPGFDARIEPRSAPRIQPEFETRNQNPPQPSSSTPPAAERTRVPAEAGAGTMTVAPNDRQLVPVRAYLRSSQIPPPSIGAYGIVAFRAKPTSASRSRLLMACEAFVAAIPTQKSVPGTVRVGDEMLTIWPLDDPESPNAAKDDCNFAIDHYDLYGGDSAIADAEKQNVKFGADGPFLIGWSPSNTRGVPDKFVLLIDMSEFNSQDSFDHAFQLWKQEIVENPSLWRNGFSIEAIRLAVRDFADHYGDTILAAAVSVWKK
jgi:hypothetical protein